jgi:hypothetical protein
VTPFDFLFKEDVRDILHLSLSAKGGNDEGLNCLAGYDVCFDMRIGHFWRLRLGQMD